MDGHIGFYLDPENVSLVQPGATVGVGDLDLTIAQLRQTDRGFQVVFEGRGSREGVVDLRGMSVFVSQRRKLDPDEFWAEDLIGLEVFFDTSEKVGIVERVEHGPAQDRLVVKGAAGSFQVPLVDALVPIVDLDAGRVVIANLPGLTEPPG